MSELKVAIGKKIRELREQRKMTRELLCEDETRLTVRQLARIGAGDSIPSLLTLEFIAQQLRIEMYQGKYKILVIFIMKIGNLEALTSSIFWYNKSYANTRK